MQIQKAVREFNNLPTQNKVEKLIAILSDLKNSDTVFELLLQKVSHSTPNNASLLVLYYNIMIFADAISRYNQTKDTSLLTTAQLQLQNLHDMEQKSMLDEAEDIAKMEAILNSI